MKVKFGFSLAVLLMVFLAMGMVAAGENITQNTDNQIMSDNSLLSSDIGEEESIGENPTLATQDAPSDVEEGSSDVDLEVTVKPDVDNPQRGDTVTWKVTVKSFGGTAYNTRVYVDFSTRLKYVDSHANVGSYSPDDGQWNIGDLKDSQTASLTVKTQVLQYGTYYAHAMAFTDSKDKGAYNVATANVTVSPPPAGPVSDPKKRQHDNHQSHYLSSEQSRYRSVTKSLDNPLVEAKLDAKPTGNPVLMLLLSLTALFGVGFRKR